MRRLVPALLRSRRAPRRPQGLGVGVAEFILTMGMQNLSVALWYGATPGVEKPLEYGRMYRGLAARDSAPVESARKPLIVFSHGLRSNRYDLSWLGERLAAAGWLALAIDHPGSTPADFERAVAMRLWERARTLSTAIDGILSHPVWGAHVDAQRIAAAGHSAGGSTLLLLGGGHFNPEKFRSYFPHSCMDTMAEPVQDARVRALVLLAPGTGPAFEAAGLHAVVPPVLLFSGTHDWQTPDALCASHYARHIRHCTWEHIDKGGHYTFKPVCRSYACVRAPALCLDHPSVDRVAVHNRVAAGALEFLTQHVS